HDVARTHHRAFLPVDGTLAAPLGLELSMTWPGGRVYCRASAGAHRQLRSRWERGLLPVPRADPDKRLSRIPLLSRVKCDRPSGYLGPHAAPIRGHTASVTCAFRRCVRGMRRNSRSPRPAAFPPPSPPPALFEASQVLCSRPTRQTRLSEVARNHRIASDEP